MLSQAVRKQPLRLEDGQVLALLNSSLKFCRADCAGEWMMGNQLADDKLAIVCDKNIIADSKPMAVLKLRSAQQSAVQFMFLKSLNSQTKEPFNDPAYIHQLDMHFRDNRYYAYLRKIGVKMMIVTRSAADFKDPGCVPVLAVLEDTENFELHCSQPAKVSQQGIMNRCRPSARFLCPREEMDSAVTMLNTLTEGARADCRGAWRLGNLFQQRQHEVALHTSMNFDIKPMAALRLRYAPLPEQRIELDKLYESLNNLNKSSTCDVKIEAYMESLQTYFAHNEYYQNLMKTGVKIVVDTSNPNDFTADGFIPVKAMLDDVRVIRRIADTSRKYIETCADQLQNAKRKFLINLKTRLGDPLWDTLGPAGYFPPSHIGQMRRHFQVEDENYIFEKVRVTIKSIPLPFESVKRDIRVSRFYQELSDEIDRILALPASCPADAPAAANLEDDFVMLEGSSSVSSVRSV